ncbi:MAG: phosphodiester glycosidase family protein [Candidatus Zixiibacteriota bacterium]
MRTTALSISASICICLLCACVAPALGGDWQKLADGFEIAWFASSDSTDSDSMLTIVRVDAKKHKLMFLSVPDSDSAQNISVRKWCEIEQLALAINGGMYDDDMRTHIGVVQADGKIISKHRNKYKSAVAWNPKEDGLPHFRLYDLDEVELDSLLRQYDNVVQNLRLIKRDRDNRWEPDRGHKWTEAALVEDSAGNALFILCRTPMTMYEFNERILALPLGIVAAQHLEGGVQTQVCIRVGEYSEAISGGFESRMDTTGETDFFFKLPHVIGVRLSPEE